MSERQQRFREDIRFRILRHLGDNPDVSQRELAKGLGVSLGALNYTLSALINVGLIKIGSLKGVPSKRRQAYMLTRKGLAEKSALNQQVLQRKLKEFDALKSEIEELKREICPVALKKPNRSDK